MGNTQGIKNATLKVQAEYARIIKAASRSALQYGKNNAAKEIGVKAHSDPAELLAAIDIQADAIATRQIADIVGQSKTAYAEALNKGLSITAAPGAADAVAHDAIEGLVADTKTILLSGYVNHGRNVVHEDNAAKIYALQRSERWTAAPATTACRWTAALSSTTTRSAATPSSTAPAAAFGYRSLWMRRRSRQFAGYRSPYVIGSGMRSVI